MSTAVYINPETRDLEIDEDGQIRETTDVSPELVLAIGIRRDSFHGDPDAGSRLYQATQGAPPADLDAFVDAEVRDALARLERQGLATIQAVAVDGANVLVDIVELPETLLVTAL